MKKLKLLLMIFVAGGLLLTTSCSKEGEQGLAGDDGIDGTDGLNGDIISASDQNAYNAADGVLGGKFYDKFYDSGLGLTLPGTFTGSDFYRCKACHGWDMLGNKGAYANRAGTATRPNVAPNNLHAFAAVNNIREIFDAIKNTGGRSKMAGNDKSLNDNHPDYGLLLSDANIWDIVKYLKTEAVNTFNLYDITVTGLYPNGVITYTNVGKDGSDAAGNAYYTNNCTGCHGADGRTIALGTRSVGDFAREKPNEMWHKVKFGQLGSTMAAGWGTITESDIKDLYVATADITNFPPL